MIRNFVNVADNGNFELEGKRWYCHSAIYFGHKPGSMNNWFTDETWAYNESLLEKDFSEMEKIGINHIALFLSNNMFFDNGKIVEKGFDRLDKVIETAASHNVRSTLFTGGFIDSEDVYRLITGKDWTYGNEWLPSFNPALFDAYYMQVEPQVQRYKNNPAVLGYGDRIDRFYKGFDNVGIPFNLKEEWAAWLLARYGTFNELLERVGGKLEGNPADFNEVLLPQESKYNASLHYPLAYDYALMQKSEIGNAQSRWDSEMLKLTPNQVMWTPFEGCSIDWVMLDGFTPETKKLHAIWMEYYHWQVVRQTSVNDWAEHMHTREFTTNRLADRSPSVYNMAYSFTRYVKQSVQRPVVLCHGVRLDAMQSGADTENQQLAMFDRVNAASLAADCDGWHYWCWTDDDSSSLSNKDAQLDDPTVMYFQGESMGLYNEKGHPRPVVALVSQYTNELKRRSARDHKREKSEVLMLSTSAKQYTLYRRMIGATATAVTGGLLRVGVEPDYLWTGQNDIHIDYDTIKDYKLIVIADNMYSRDFRENPDMLVKYVENGGNLYIPLGKYDGIEDEYGVFYKNKDIEKLAGYKENGKIDWPGAKSNCPNWPFPTEVPNEPNFDYSAFARLYWGICPEYRHLSPHPYINQSLMCRSTDDDYFTSVPALVENAKVIAVGKEFGGNSPFYYMHELGKGKVFVNAWTNNCFRDTWYKHDHGGWEYDFMLSIAVNESNILNVDLTHGGGFWLRNSFGYNWRDY